MSISEMSVNLWLDLKGGNVGRRAFIESNAVFVRKVALIGGLVVVAIASEIAFAVGIQAIALSIIGAVAALLLYVIAEIYLLAHNVEKIASDETLSYTIGHENQYVHHLFEGCPLSRHLFSGGVRLAVETKRKEIRQQEWDANIAWAKENLGLVWGAVRSFFSSCAGNPSGRRMGANRS